LLNGFIQLGESTTTFVYQGNEWGRTPNFHWQECLRSSCTIGGMTIIFSAWRHHGPYKKLAVPRVRWYNGSDVFGSDIYLSAITWPMQLKCVFKPWRRRSRCNLLSKEDERWDDQVPCLQSSENDERWGLCFRVL
jgi:hypothetical protein